MGPGESTSTESLDYVKHEILFKKITYRAIWIQAVVLGKQRDPLITYRLFTDVAMALRTILAWQNPRVQRKE